MNYYLKLVHPPIPTDTLREGEDCTIHFTKESRRYAERFSECRSFLVYATGHTEDGMKIFASGEPLLPWPKDVWDTDPREVDGVRYPLGVEVHINKRVDVAKGVPRTTMIELCPRLGKTTFHAHGGLIKISPEEFEVLNTALNNAVT